MTDAELQALCRRHAIPPDDAQKVLDRVISQLVPQSPKGIGLAPEHIGSVMEATAHLNDVMNDVPYDEAEFCSTGEAVIRFLRKGDFQ